MKNQVTYLMSGPAHLPYLVCSLYTLRQHYSGKVEVYAWPESMELVERIGRDRRLAISFHERHPKLRGRDDGIGGNGQFLDKIDLTMSLSCDFSLYLDADTTIHGPLDRLFEVAEKHGFCATQFCGWKTNGGVVRKRLHDLYLVPEIPASYITTITQTDYPSLNGGVWCASPNSAVLPAWYEWTRMCGTQFIADEKVLHLMMIRQSLGVLMDHGKWNCSHKHISPNLKPEDVVVWHYHGDSNVRVGKSPKAFDQWMDIYNTCINNNIGGLREWRGECGNRYLKAAETEYFDWKVV